MSNTPILSIPEVAPNQDAKEITINDGFVAVENATQGVFAVTFTSNAATLSVIQFTGSFQFTVGSQTAAATLTLPTPLTQRFFLVNNSAGTFTVTVGGTTGATVVVGAAALSLIFCDGTNCTAVLAGGATAGVTNVLGDTGSITLSDLEAGGVATLDSPTFTTVVNLPAVSGSDSSSKAAYTSWVSAYVTGLSLAPLASPTFAGTPRITAAPGATDSSSAIPTTNWVQNLCAATTQGLSVKLAVRMLAPGNVTISSPGITTIDGVTANNGDRVALINQTTASQNGIYIWNGSASAMTLAPDFAVSADVEEGTFFWVAEGTTYGHTGWILVTSGTITLGTTSLNFTQFSGGGVTYTFSSGVGLVGTSVTVDFTVVAPLASPAFTGTVTVPTPGSTDNTTKASNTAWVQAYVASLNYVTAGSSPVVSVLGATGAVILSDLVTGGVAPLASPTFSGTVSMSGAATVSVPTVATSDKSTNAASTAFVKAQGIRTIPFSLIGKPPASQTFNICITQAGTLLANGGTPQGFIKTNPTATQDLVLNTINSGTITTQGTIAIDTAGSITWPTFANVALPAGDTIQLVNQALQDSTFADACLSLQFLVT